MVVFVALPLMGMLMCYHEYDIPGLEFLRNEWHQNEFSVDLEIVGAIGGQHTLHHRGRGLRVHQR